MSIPYKTACLSTVPCNWLFLFILTIPSLSGSVSIYFLHCLASSRFRFSSANLDFTFIPPLTSLWVYGWLSSSSKISCWLFLVDFPIFFDFLAITDLLDLVGSIDLVPDLDPKPWITLLMSLDRDMPDFILTTDLFKDFFEFKYTLEEVGLLAGMFKSGDF